LAVASQFGITLAVSVVLGYFAGHWLDDRFHTAIIFTLIGVLLGLVAAVLNTVRLYSALLRKTSTPATTTPTTPPSGPSAAPTASSARPANDGTPLDADPD
jgi:F0F1-type ATP synthase assembly protein I